MNPHDLAQENAERISRAALEDAKQLDYPCCIDPDFEKYSITMPEIDNFRRAANLCLEIMRSHTGQSYIKSVATHLYQEYYDLIGTCLRVYRRESMDSRPDRPDWQLKAMAKETGAKFMGFPERWFDDLTWRCENGHVSKVYLKSEGLGRAACLECSAPIWMTYPEDTE